MNSPDIISSDSSDSPSPSARSNRFPLGRLSAAAALTAVTVAGAPTARQPAPAPIKAGEEVELEFAYQSYSPDGDAYNISTQPGVEGSSQTGTQSPTYAGIGVTFDQYPGDRSKNTSYLLVFVSDQDPNASLVKGVARIGHQSYDMQLVEEGGTEQLLVKVNCKNVQRHPKLPVEIDAFRSNGSKVTLKGAVNSLSVSSYNRSCTPESLI